MTNKKIISMQFHPRAFAAFGADLVTSDIVAVTELVKNCYDAFAYNVVVELGEDKQGKYLQISDDGFGMTSDIIENSWAVIATPYKENNPTVTRDGKVRRVSGNKGLGRFSAARLGNVMHVWTKNANDTYLHAKMNWNDFLASSNVSDCVVTIETLFSIHNINQTGTIIRIRQLQSEWSKDDVDELRDGLSRLISPFKEVEKFSITLVSDFYEEPIKIITNKLIDQPVYKIQGKVAKTGLVTWDYEFNPVNKSISTKKRTGRITWEESRKGFDKNLISQENDITKYKAGEFTFEIRMWDLDKDSISDLVNAFNIKSNAIRNTIKYYMGLSIYRDDVLVLPKSPASKDWLGIDLRRVSSLGKRISTSQIVGIINISSMRNPGLRDATDREKLVDSLEYKQFTKVAESIIGQLQNLRNLDKTDVKRDDTQSFSNLLAPLTAQALVLKVEEAVDRGEKYENILEYVRDFSSDNEKNISILQDRLTYYAQTASVGSVSVVILHEILTGMTAIKRFLRRAFQQYSPFDKKTSEYYEYAELSHGRLLEVANCFAPLYRKDLRKSKGECDLRVTLLRSKRLIEGQKNSRDIIINEHLPEMVLIQMHEGELQTIFLNLLDNACYWLQQKGGKMFIDISAEISSNKQRISINISDNGPGILVEDAQSIFEAGVTAKPHGIGMGLVIITEILNYYNGKISTSIPGDLGGATFKFDLPIA